MPAILTHYTFAKGAIHDSERAYSDVVFLGAQGPDTFMACGSIPWRKRVEGAKNAQWGHTMHSLPVGSVYPKMMEYAYASPDKDLLFAYIDGILMHYAVDRLCHPYIFYRSGFDENGKLVGYWSWSHGFFEANLDQRLAKEEGTYQKMSCCIKCRDEEQVKKISEMWAHASPAHLSIDAFYQSYIDFVSAENMLYTPSGLKRPLFRLIGKYSTPWAQSHPRFPKKFDAIDFLNEKHSAWFDPCTGEEHHTSFRELLAKAKEEYEEAHALLLRAKNGENIQEEFDRWCRNLDHDGSPLGSKKVHQDLCWTILGKAKFLPK